MELDTGASMSVMSEKLYKQLWPGRSLSTTPIRLQTYSKQPLDVIGSPLFTMKPTLFGRNWLSVICLNSSHVHYVRAPGLEDMLRKYSAVFDKELGMFKGPDVTISMDPDATPRFCKARVIPYAMRDSVEEELDWMVKEGTLIPVEYSE